MFDFWSLIRRAKQQGKRFLVAETKDGKGFEVFFTESNNRLPDFLTGITVEVAKKISEASGGKYTPTKALDAVLTHVNTAARIAIENYENSMNGNGDEASNDLPDTSSSSLN
jgi:hypothetical protein